MQKFLAVIFIGVLLSQAANAQSGLALQGSQRDDSLPVEVTADNLVFDQETQLAIFEGNAVAVQGDVRLQADLLEVSYDQETGQISELSGNGNVVYENGVERAEAETLAYTATSDFLTLEGAVTLIQGQTVLSANKMILNVTSNAAELTGNVRTRFVPRN